MQHCGRVGSSPVRWWWDVLNKTAEFICFVNHVRQNGYCTRARGAPQRHNTVDALFMGPGKVSLINNCDDKFYRASSSAMDEMGQILGNRAGRGGRGGGIDLMGKLWTTWAKATVGEIVDLNYELWELYWAKKGQ